MRMQSCEKGGRLYRTLRRSLCLKIVVLLSLAPVARGASLIVSVEDVRAGTGAVRVAIYSDADSFRHEERAVQVLSAPANSDVISVVFHGLKSGPYAVVAYHDANNNKKLDLFLGFLPQEGWGLSNNPKIVVRPLFSASVIDVAEPTTSTLIWLHY